MLTYKLNVLFLKDVMFVVKQNDDGVIVTNDFDGDGVCDGAEVIVLMI